MVVFEAVSVDDQLFDLGAEYNNESDIDLESFLQIAVI